MNDPHAALTEIANGDESARQFLVVVYEFVHMLDDLVDRDVQRKPEEIVVVLAAFVETVAANEFFQAHRPALLAALRSGMIAWAASEEFKTREAPLDRLAGEVLKSHYQELFFLSASLTGGMPHALKMSSKYRGYKAG